VDEKEFWIIVDKYANKDLLEKRDGNWRLKKENEQLLRE